MSSQPARWTDAEVADYMRRYRGEQLPASSGRNDVPKRITARSKKMNATEAAWSHELTIRVNEGKLVKWGWEDTTLKLANDCRYIPDFRGLKPALGTSYYYGQTVFYEVKREWKPAKGKKRTGRPHIEDDARVKLAVAAKQFEEYEFWLVWLDCSGTWHEERVQP